jgi:hypothetical protein
MSGNYIHDGTRFSNAVLAVENRVTFKPHQMQGAWWRRLTGREAAAKLDELDTTLDFYLPFGEYTPGLAWTQPNGEVMAKLWGPNGRVLIVNAEFLDFILARFPDARLYGSGPHEPILVEIKRRRVGVLMPVWRYAAPEDTIPLEMAMARR